MELAKAKHAFITGGANGIGLGVAEALADRGIAVTIADVDQTGIEAAIARRPDRFHGAVLDTRDREAWTQAKARSEAKFGPVDILMNNAGIGPNRSDFADMDPASFDRIIAINLTGVTTARLNDTPPPSVEMPSSEVSIADVATAVLAAIAENKTYIVTHARYWPQVEQRMIALRDAFA